MTFLPLSSQRIQTPVRLLCAAALGLVPASLSAQAFPFALRLQQGTIVTNVPNQGTISMVASGIGKPAGATLTVTYQGTATVTVAGTPTLAQATQDFTANFANTVPVLNPGDSFVVNLQFNPSAAATETALLSINYTQAGVSSAIQLTLVGATSSLSVSYTLPTNQNTVPLPAGGTVQFPPTQVSTSIIATVAITNNGAGAGTVDTISIPAGSAFQLVNLPLLKATVNPGVTLIFGVKYTPTQAATDTGSLQISLNGSVQNYNLSGSGITSSYSYVISTDAGDTPITPNQTANPISFPDTAIGGNNNFFIKVRNVGAAVGTIFAINATGSFAVTDGPPIFPVTMNPNDQITFTLTFAPVLPGKLTGRLTVGSDVFSLTGVGLGPKLTFSYGPSNVAVLPTTGVVVFSPVAVGQSTQQSFTVLNAGTAAITVASIAVADTKGVFKLLNQPPGPTTLNPNDTLTFNIKFTPAITGFSTTLLQIDTQSFTLSGSGTPPPNLPPIQFTGTSGNVTPLQQPSIGLSLASPYSLPLTGVLTLSINSATFAPDPSVQFATGGRTVTFSIPAGSTDAIFPTGSTQILLQSGSTAGAINITSTIATQSGLDMTPASPPAVTLTVPAAAPQLVQALITSANQAGFAVGVIGLSTTHSLQTLTYTFTPTGNGKPVSYVIPVSAASGLWFTSANAQPFGGQFSVSVPFAIPSPSATSLSTANLHSVSITAANAQGTSNTITVTIQ